MLSKYLSKGNSHEYLDINAKLWCGSEFNFICHMEWGFQTRVSLKSNLETWNSIKIKASVYIDE